MRFFTVSDMLASFVILKTWDTATAVLAHEPTHSLKWERASYNTASSHGVHRTCWSCHALAKQWWPKHLGTFPVPGPARRGLRSCVSRSNPDFFRYTCDMTAGNGVSKSFHKTQGCDACQRCVTEKHLATGNVLQTCTLPFGASACRSGDPLRIDGESDAGAPSAPILFIDGLFTGVARIERMA